MTTASEEVPNRSEPEVPSWFAAPTAVYASPRKGRLFDDEDAEIHSHEGWRIYWKDTVWSPATDAWLDRDDLPAVYEITPMSKKEAHEHVRGLRLALIKNLITELDPEKLCGITISIGDSS